MRPAMARRATEWHEHELCGRLSVAFRGSRWAVVPISIAAPRSSLRHSSKPSGMVHGFGNFASQRVLPKTTLEVTFNLGPPHRLTHPGGAVINRYAWVSGLQQRPFVVQPCFDVTRFTVPPHRGEPIACWRICVFRHPHGRAHERFNRA